MGAETSAGCELEIERLAVPRSLKGHGFGSMMMRWIMAEVARMPQSDCSAITCNALSNVVKFYESQGFKLNPDRQPPQQEGEDDPNMFMELPNVSLVTTASSEQA